MAFRDDATARTSLTGRGGDYTGSPLATSRAVPFCRPLQSIGLFRTGEARVTRCGEGSGRCRSALLPGFSFAGTVRYPPRATLPAHSHLGKDASVPSLDILRRPVAGGESEIGGSNSELCFPM